MAVSQKLPITSIKIHFTEWWESVQGKEITDDVISSIVSEALDCADDYDIEYIFKSCSYRKDIGMGYYLTLDAYFYNPDDIETMTNILYHTLEDNGYAGDASFASEYEEVIDIR